MQKKCRCCGHIINDNADICSSCRSRLSQEQYLLLLSLFDKQDTQEEEAKQYKQLHYYQTMQYNHVIQHQSTHINNLKDTIPAEKEILKKLAINDAAPVIFEVLLSQIKNSDNNFNVYMPNGILQVYASAILKCDGHIFITLPKNRPYRLFDTTDLKSEKEYSALELLVQNSNYIMSKNNQPTQHNIQKKSRGKTR